MSMHTPWGPAHSADELAPGIISVSTGSHGGIHLNSRRVEQLPAPLRSITPFAGLGWYEEDCDWIIPALAWPDVFGAHSVCAAVASALAFIDPAHYLNPVRAWVASKAGASVRAIYDTQKLTNSTLYRVICSGSPPRRHEAAAKALAGLYAYRHQNLHWAALRRVSDGAEAEALLIGYDLYGRLIDLDDIPAERILRQPAPGNA